MTIKNCLITYPSSLLTLVPQINLGEKRGALRTDKHAGTNDHNYSLLRNKNWIRVHSTQTHTHKIFNSMPFDKTASE